MVEQYVSERASPAEVIDVEVEVEDGVTLVDVVIAGSFAAPPVTALAETLSEVLSAPVRARLLLVSSQTRRATAVP